MSKFVKICSMVLVIVIFVSLSLVGCGGSNKSTNVTTTSNVESTNQSTGITSSDVKWDKTKNRKIVLSTIKDYYTTALQQIAKDYTSLHPETEVEIQIMGSNDVYTQSFTTKMNTDKSTAPDIIHTNLIAGNTEGDMINKGWLKGLDELLDETNPYNGGQKVRDAFNDPFYLTQAVSSAGKVGYLPFDLVGVGVFYNKDIFNKAGVAVPETYEDLETALGTLQKAGYQYPLGATAFCNWFGTSLIDWGFRKMEADFLVMPGDGLYDEKTMSANSKISYSSDNPNFDSAAIFNNEKIVAYVNKNGIDNPVTKKIWETQKSILKYCPPGWVNPDDGQTYNQFLAQKVPAFVTGSWNVGKLVSDISKLSDDKKFKWGVFKFPKFKNADQDFQGEPRGLLVPGHKLGIVNKGDDDLYYRTADFLKYMYSPDIAAKIYDITLKHGELVQGPSLIKGVKLSDEINGYLDGFKVAGTMRWELDPLVGCNKKADEPKSNKLRSDYVSGKITYEQYIKGEEDLTKAWVDDQKKTQGYDLDPKTVDKAPGAK